jgi:hypothetical protein
MPDPTTTNLVMAQPIRGTDVGTWDVPVNGNTGIIDQAFGSVTTLALSSSPINLTSSQAQNAIIRLTGTITANVPIFLPSIYKFWTIDNQITNSPSSFCAILISTTSSGQGIGLPPGTQDVFYDGAAVNYRNLGNVGGYWDYVGTTIPSWVSACTKLPYLNCDGTTFSSATYPILSNLLGGNTLPDSRGRMRAVLNQGTGRMTSTGGGVDGNTLLASGGSQSATLITANLPPYTPTGTINTTVSQNGVANISGPIQFGGTGSGGNLINPTAVSSFTGVAQGGTSTPVATVPPAYVGGLTMIRAA